MIVLAHNASMCEVPFDFGRLMDEPAAGLYYTALSQVVDQVAQSRERQANTPPSG